MGKLKKGQLEMVNWKNIGKKEQIDIAYTCMENKKLNIAAILVDLQFTNWK